MCVHVCCVCVCVHARAPGVFVCLDTFSCYNSRCLHSEGQTVSDHVSVSGCVSCITVCMCLVLPSVFSDSNVTLRVDRWLFAYWHCHKVCLCEVLSTVDTTTFGCFDRVFFGTMETSTSNTSCPTWNAWWQANMRAASAVLLRLLLVSCVAVMEWQWQGTTEVLGIRPLPVLLCPPQIKCGLACNWTQPSVVRGRWLTALHSVNGALAMWEVLWDIWFCGCQCYHNDGLLFL